MINKEDDQYFVSHSSCIVVYFRLSRDTLFYILLRLLDRRLRERERERERTDNNERRERERGGGENGQQCETNMTRNFGFLYMHLIILCIRDS